MSEIEFRDPPFSQRHKGSWVARLSPLIDNPQRWAVVHRMENVGSVSAVASGLRNGRYRIPEGRWEFRSVDTELFARYLGPDEPTQLREVLG